jgi:antitoxin HigA-1
MIPENRIPTHPGEILSEEFLKPLNIPQTKLAEKLGISVQRVNELVNGKRGVTPETAWLLAGAFGTSPEFWANLQTAYDLARVRPSRPVKRLAMTGAR